jgi:hypothetical protein
MNYSELRNGEIAATTLLTFKMDTSRKTKLVNDFASLWDTVGIIVNHSHHRARLLVQQYRTKRTEAASYAKNTII